jgi:hypothetical protein
MKYVIEMDSSVMIYTRIRSLIKIGSGNETLIGGHRHTNSKTIS